MRVASINSNQKISNRTPSYKGRLSKNTSLMLGEMQVCINNAYKGAINKNNKYILSVSKFEMVNRLANIYDNLSTIMERFGHACELTYSKSEKTGIHRFYIENQSSNYKLMCGDIKFTSEHNTLTDIDKLENLEKNMEKLNPYQENSNFIIQRKSSAKDVSYDRDFEPDADYIFFEDKLIGKEPLTDATEEDIKEFISAAKEDGVV